MEEAGQSKEMLVAKVNKYKRLYEGIAKTVEGYEKTIEQLKARNQFLEAQLINADERVWIYKDATQKNIEDSRKKELELVKEIQQLQKELKDARSQLGNESDNSVQVC